MRWTKLRRTVLGYFSRVAPVEHFEKSNRATFPSSRLQRQLILEICIIDIFYLRFWSLLFPFCSLIFSALSAHAITAATTVYVGQHFEVRELNAATKYVFNGSTRVAKVTGSLSGNRRVQRVRVSTGWNLCSVAVSVPNALQSLSASGGDVQDEVVRAAYKWNPNTSGWELIHTNDTLTAGTVLWLNVTTNCTLRVTGTYSGPPSTLRVPAEGAFLPGFGLGVLPTTNLPASVTAWHFDANAGTWKGQHPPPPQAFTNFPSELAPGQAFFAQAPVTTELALPDPALSLRFYHQDHLGSSSVVTDSAGKLVEESAKYPFGHSRHQHTPKGIHEAYQFTQKETDLESGFHYFEARFLSAIHGRFMRVDALCADFNRNWIMHPQYFHLYAYALNNPLRFVDPTGLDPLGTSTSHDNFTTDPRGNFTTTIQGVQVTILPDQRDPGGKVRSPSTGTTYPSFKAPGIQWEFEGKTITKVKITGATLTIQTFYKQRSNPEAQSAYGVGTRATDIATGKGTVRVHEGSHGAAAMDFLRYTPMPEFKGKVGMTTTEFRAAVDAYTAEITDYAQKLSRYSNDSVDCVGTPASFCIQPFPESNLLRSTPQAPDAVDHSLRGPYRDR